MSDDRRNVRDKNHLFFLQRVVKVLAQNKRMWAQPVPCIYSCCLKEEAILEGLALDAPASVPGAAPPPTDL